MLYLAIDQHAKQITVCVRNEDGDTVLRRQVSTRPEKIEAFFEQFTEMNAEFMAILEVCGFNDWLIEELRKWKCREIVLIHPEKPSKNGLQREPQTPLFEQGCDRQQQGERHHCSYRISHRETPWVVGIGGRWSHDANWLLT